MPNHVTTRCTVTGPATDIAKFREQVFTIKNEETYLDFDKIIPSPPIVSEVEESSINEAAAALIVARADGASSLEIRISVSDSITNKGFPRRNEYAKWLCWRRGYRLFCQIPERKHKAVFGYWRFLKLATRLV